MRRVLLVDNGSLEPASMLQARRLAKALGDASHSAVVACSVAHSDKIPPLALGGRAASLLPVELERAAADGVDELAVVPLFIGPSYAIVRHVPALIAEFRTRHPHVRVALAGPLAHDGEPRLARIVTEHVRAHLPALKANDVRVAVVDHGSPSADVTRVRDQIAGRVRAELGAAVADVSPASMERRAGPEFDFNEPTLANLLARDSWRRGPVVIALLFIAPGRHAGPDGDVARIVATARADDLAKVRFTPLLGEHPFLREILADRTRTASASLARSSN